MGTTLLPEIDLPAPPWYFPAASGRYDVNPGLRPLRTDFGNGPADARLFQIDREFAAFRESKLRCRREALGKYYGTERYDPATASAVARLVITRLVEEHPDRFAAESAGGGGVALQCRPTAETLRFGPEMALVGADSAEAGPAYASALDALACQVQEDLAVSRVDQEGGDWLAAVHVCHPSRWRPVEKLGQSFVAVHEPVPGIERVSRASSALLSAMVTRGPFVRFVWGITGDARLNQHPEPPPGVSPDEWNGPAFRADQPEPFYFRVERQVLWGLREVGASLFAIRPYVTPASALDPAQRAAVRSGLLSMSPESRAYKSVD